MWLWFLQKSHSACSLLSFSAYVSISWILRESWTNYRLSWMVWMRWYPQLWLQTPRFNHSWVAQLMYGCQLLLPMLRRDATSQHQLEPVSLKSMRNSPTDGSSIITLFLYMFWVFGRGENTKISHISFLLSVWINLSVFY